jgi:hypothetical protein
MPSAAMKLLRRLLQRFGRHEEAEMPVMEPIYIYLPEALEPEERGPRYGDWLDAELKLFGLGFVSGGGTLLAEDEEGERAIISCGIDVDTSDVDAARALLREHLPDLGCPRGTELQYSEALCDHFDGRHWAMARHR